MFTVNHTIGFEIVECIFCGVLFTLPPGLEGQKRDDHSNFYCPNGHAQIFVGETEEEKLTQDVRRLKVLIGDRGRYIDEVEVENAKLGRQVARLKKAKKGKTNA